MTMLLNSDGTLLGVQGADKLIEVYHVRSEEEIKKKLKRRAKRIKEKARAHHGMCMSVFFNRIYMHLSDKMKGACVL